MQHSVVASGNYFQHHCAFSIKSLFHCLMPKNQLTCSHCCIFNTFGKREMLGHCCIVLFHVCLRWLDATMRMQLSVVASGNYFQHHCAFSIKSLFYCLVPKNQLTCSHCCIFNTFSKHEM